VWIAVWVSTRHRRFADVMATTRRSTRDICSTCRAVAFLRRRAKRIAGHRVRWVVAHPTFSHSTLQYCA
jgi:hypothetical protein